jgi:hypothetical protein
MLFFSFQKAKISKGRRSAIIRSPDTLGLCSENGCKSVLYKGFEEADCCCNTDLCNNSNTITKSLISFIGFALLAGMNIILKY